MPRLTGDHGVVLAALGVSLAMSTLYLWEVAPLRDAISKDGSAAAVIDADSDGAPPSDHPTGREVEAAMAAPIASAAVSPTQAAPGDSPVVSQQTHYDLMARVSHELRTPLNAVVGFSDLMGHELFGPLGHPRYEEYVRHIRDSGRQLLKSAEDTLAIASMLTRVEAPEAREVVAFSRIAADALDIVAAEAGSRSIEIASHVESDLMVLADRRALRQIIVNLLSEALSRSPRHGAIQFNAVAIADKAAVTIAIEHCQCEPADSHASLPICLARTLIEHSGGQLFESRKRPGTWQVATYLERAVQHDFFLPRASSGHAAGLPA
ncbi:MAG: sensor histidine kinase [Hyphomicrobiaceae bacterium]